MTARSDVALPWSAGAASCRIANAVTKRMKKNRRVDPARKTPRMSLRTGSLPWIAPRSVAGGPGGKDGGMEGITGATILKLVGPPHYRWPGSDDQRNHHRHVPYASARRAADRDANLGGEKRCLGPSGALIFAARLIARSLSSIGQSAALSRQRLRVRAP